jgi:NADH-quinone oxidoreductase subunit F
VKTIVEIGGDAYAKIGTPNNTGTRIFCVSGHVQRPGYYEFEVGKITLGQLLNDVCGGPRPGRTFKAVIPGGSSAKVLRAGERFKGKRKVGLEMVDYDWGIEDVPMDFDSLAMIGSMGGSGGVIVMDDSVDMVAALANINAFYAHESCGQCTPCREGSLWMKKVSSRMVHGQARAEDGALLKSIADQIAGRTICAFGEACAWPTQSFVAKFGEEFKAYPETRKAAPTPAVPLV